MVIRRQGREIVLQLLYQYEWDAKKGVRELVDGYVHELAMREFQEDDPVLEFVFEWLSGVLEHRDDLDLFIREKTKGWRVSRLALVDRNILRLGVFELYYRRDIPPKVAINEAVELAKKFGSDESSAFINGILDAVLKDMDEMVRA
ncbi:MAG: transcription antitermination factor NusB [Desulfobacteraceae bacterium]|nr:transcription antitermination factor NusB [Desulfobacteraceae bacterium]